MAETADTRATYRAHCHCGAVRFEVTLPKPLSEHLVNQCNCSICSKNGYLFVYPKRDELKHVQGEDNITKYYFGHKQKAHCFCKTCGSSLFIDCKDTSEGDPMKNVFAVNVRTFADIELEKLKYRYFNGKEKLDPPYKVDWE